jgi:hypothetical protein
MLDLLLKILGRCLKWGSKKSLYIYSKNKVDANKWNVVVGGGGGKGT